MELDRFGSQKDLGLIFLPGLFAGGWIWSKVVAQLEAAGYSGGVFKTAFAEIPPIGDPLEYLAKSARMAIDQCGFTKTIVCGNSLGGFLALRLFLSQEANTVGCVASGTPGLSKVSDLGLAAKRFFTFTDAEKVSRLLFVDTSCVSDAQIEASLRYFTNRRSLMNIARYMNVAADVDLGPTLAELQSPVLFVWGREDQVTPLGPLSARLSSFQSIELRVVESCGHSPMIERPQDFFEALSLYIEKLGLSNLTKSAATGSNPGTDHKLVVQSSPATQQSDIG